MSLTSSAQPPDATGLRTPGPAVAVVACLAQFMVVLDALIVQVALPSMRDGLGMSAGQQQWVINAYLLLFGGLLLLGGRAADLFGRKRVFLAGLGVFTLFSLLGGLALSGPMLIAARALQGVGAAMLAPAPIALITAVYTEPAARTKAMSIWSAATTLAGSIAVLLGGALTDSLGWRWVLLVNVPIGIALFAVSLRALPALEPPASSRPRTLDVPGALTATIGLGALVLGVGNAENTPWSSPQVCLPLIIAVVLLTVFVLLESRVAQPLVRLAVFRVRSLSVGNVIMMVAGALTTCSVYFISLYLQGVQHYSALSSGLAILPMTIAIALASLFARKLVGLVGPKTTLIAGALVAAAGLLWQARFSADSPYLTEILGPTVLIGLGLGTAVLPITMAAMTGVPPTDAGLASALMNTSRQVGGSIGVAALSTVAAAMADATAGYGAALLTAGVLAVAIAVLAVGLPKAAK
ncbi:DHA2 family efflux MFS transporter permease subunit [Kutzneria kofuensis]|uniref:EmrB/QacA subfamily drug resistance transporter n=1 Tax=Kutzneria kofuensis TaxID=103725 RepID=A0A7W9KCU3_9PSEU|nr:DHA2 family efflux MFS transporter permease subunit [Kutzneria kofuensis]MBB5890252.1 EmrB/QacA subfamily drug resistance transporter [Kutzneria kofuensis]